MKVVSETENTRVGTNVLIKCDEGFMLIGDNTVVCLSIEKWSESPSCIAVNCGIPKIVANSVITNISETTYNSTFVVECKEGYNMSSSETVKCNMNGEWNPIPSCNKVTCGLPTIPANGSISHIAGTSFQATASLKCNEGFIIVGDPVIDCLSNGSWSRIPICQDYDTFSDCFDVFHQGNITEDGVYTISTSDTHRQIQVYCDMNTAGGGWTVFQNRFDGSVEFYRNFSEYENGFGNIQEEFWLGLKNLYELVAQGPSELRIDVSSASGSKGYGTFQNFSISPAPSYLLRIALGTGTIGYSIANGLSFNNNSAFSTYDRDMDNYEENCALNNEGAWWYSRCMNVHLNGKYCTPGTKACGYHGMIYYNFLGLESLLTSRMMFRRV